MLSLFLVSAFFSNPASAEGAAAEVGRDVQVLHAWISQRVGPPSFRTDLGIPLKDCVQHERSREPRGKSRRPFITFDSDCTERIESALGVPLVNEVRFTSHSDGYDDVMERINSQEFNCQAIEIRTVLRAEALAAPSFRGIGFYTPTGIRFFPVDKLKEVGRVVLAQGGEGLVHRFAGVGLCWKSGESPLASRAFEFKPFVRYEAPDGRIYEQWQDVKQNHVISFNAPSLNCERELLSQL